MFDIFVSYNSRDKQEVIRICDLLKNNNITPWLDIWAVPPGTNWQTEILKAINDDNIKAAIVCFGNSGMGHWQDEEQQAILLRFKEKK